MATSTPSEEISSNLLKIQLVNLRKAKHMTQKDIANKTGLSLPCINNIENISDTSPTLRSIIKYISALDGEIFIKEVSENTFIKI